MKTENVIQAALFMGILFSSIGIPVLAYSGEAVGLFDQGNALMKTKNYSEAIVVFDKAITLEPDYFEAWNGKADALNRAQQFTDALTASDKVIALNPNYVQGWINRGYILYNLGQYDEELNAYETAIALDPASPEAWFNKGYSLASMNRYDEAIAAFDKVKELDPTYPNLAANRQIAEQYRNATTPFTASKKTPAQSPVKTSSILPEHPAATTEPKKSPIIVGGIIGIFLILMIVRHIRKSKK